MKRVRIRAALPILSVLVCMGLCLWVLRREGPRGLARYDEWERSVVRLSTGGVFARLAPQRTVDYLLEQGEANPGGFIYAIKELGAVAVDPLCRVVTQREAPVERRRLACGGLALVAELAPERSFAALAAVLDAEGEDPRVKRSAAAALSACGMQTSSYWEYLERLVRSEWPEVREFAALSLYRGGRASEGSAAAAVLLEALSDRSDPAHSSGLAVEVMAADAGGVELTRAARRTLYDVFRDGPPSARVSAAIALVRFASDAVLRREACLSMVTALALVEDMNLLGADCWKCAIGDCPVLR